MITLVSEIIISICVFVLAFNAMMLFRNNIVYKIRMRASKEYYDLAMKTLDVTIQHRFDTAGSYDSMMYQFRKWKFEDFYPDLANKDT